MKVYDIVCLQYDEAADVLKMLDAGDIDDALNYLAQWDYGGESEHTETELNHKSGGLDLMDSKGDYIILYNYHLDYVALYRKVLTE